jgi:hypothetical protein
MISEKSYEDISSRGMIAVPKEFAPSTSFPKYPKNDCSYETPATSTIPSTHTTASSPLLDNNPQRMLQSSIPHQTSLLFRQPYPSLFSFPSSPSYLPINQNEIIAARSTLVTTTETAVSQETEKTSPQLTSCPSSFSSLVTSINSSDMILPSFDEVM